MKLLSQIVINKIGMKQVVLQGKKIRHFYKPYLHAIFISHFYKTIIRPKVGNIVVSNCLSANKPLLDGDKTCALL